MKTYIALAIVLLSLGPLAEAANEFICNGTIQHVSGDSGQLVIDRSIGSCLIGGAVGSKFFGFKTDNLKLYDGESILATSGDLAQKSRTISGPIDSDYLVFGMLGITLEFKLNKISDPSADSKMYLEYFQNSDSVPIDGDKPSEMSILSFDLDKYNLLFAKSIKDSVYLEVLGSSDTFGHYLISESNQTIPVQKNKNNTVLIRTSPVRQDCSKSFDDKANETHEISGPDAKTITGKYKCVNIFATSQTGQAHYDVDFANFLDIVDEKDELTIDDGAQALKINKYTAKQYYQSKPTISFEGPKLAVIYDSAQVISPKAVFKLTVKAQTVGGVVDTVQTLNLPSSGSARYTLRTQSSDVVSVLEIKGGKLDGVDVKISDGQNNVITLASGKFPPPVISFNKASEDTIVEITVKSKTSTTFSYKQESSCGGTIFGSTGAISIDGASKTCYWLLGTAARLSVDSFSLLGENSCLEMYSIEQEKPVYKRCNFGPSVSLPPFVLGPAYVKVTTSASGGKFVASVAQSVAGVVQSTIDSKVYYRSSGFPTSYAWSSVSESFSVDSTNKSKVLSIAELDLRDGESFSINSKAYTNSTYLVEGDLDISRSVANVALTRSLATSDFRPHKGYSLVVSQYQAIVAANMSQKSIQTPKNITSLLLKIAAPASTRLAYTIFNATSNNPSYVMSVVDARTVLGRRVYEEERFNGSTTSSSLLISVVATNPKTTLPEFKIAYSQLACNKTMDHVCDQGTRCVPAEKLCKGKAYCLDGTDLKVACTNGPAPPPQIITTGGYSGVTVFFLSVLMFALGIMATLYGPDMYKSAENRFRSGQYTTFSSTE